MTKIITAAMVAAFVCSLGFATVARAGEAEPVPCAPNCDKPIPIPLPGCKPGMPRC